MAVTPSGTAMLASDAQLWKADSPMSRSPWGNVTLSSDMQSIKAPLPMAATG